MALVHRRVAGACKRGGRLVLVGLPDKAVFPRAPPPPESKEDIRRNKLMTKIPEPEKKQNLTLCLDGNKAYEKVSQALD